MNSRKKSSAKPFRAVRVNTRSRNVAGRGPANPPPFSSNIRTTHKYRFLSNAAFGTTINSVGCFGAAGAMGTVVNSTVALCYESLRLLKVEVWSPPASQGASATVAVEWLSTNSPSIEVSDTTMSVSHNAHISTRPPIGSLASFWQNIDTAFQLFTLTCPINSIIDVTLELLQVDRPVTSGTITGLTTVVLNTMYYLALDRGGVGTNVLIPVSLRTTT